NYLATPETRAGSSSERVTHSDDVPSVVRTVLPDAQFRAMRLVPIFDEDPLGQVVRKREIEIPVRAVFVVHFVDPGDARGASKLPPESQHVVGADKHVRRVRLNIG